jgi:hypothetical protein
MNSDDIVDIAEITLRTLLSGDTPAGRVETIEWLLAQEQDVIAAALLMLAETINPLIDESLFGFGVN